MLGSGLIVTLAVTVFTQPLTSVPVTVYVVLTVGFVVGLGQLLQFIPLKGTQI